MLSAAETLVLEFGGPNETTSHFNTMQTSPMELRYIMFEASTRLRLLAPGTGLYIKMVKIKYLWHIEPVFIYMCGPGGRPWPTELCFNKKLISYDILQIYFLCHFGGEGNFSHAAFRIFLLHPLSFGSGSDINKFDLEGGEAEVTLWTWTGSIDTVWIGAQ